MNKNGVLIQAIGPVIDVRFPSDSIPKLLTALKVNFDNHELVLEVLEANPTLRDDFKAGKTRAQGFVMGQIMKKTGGKVNPGIANKIILDELKK